MYDRGGYFDFLTLIKKGPSQVQAFWCKNEAIIFHSPLKNITRREPEYSTRSTYTIASILSSKKIIPYFYIHKKKKKV